MAEIKTTTFSQSLIRVLFGLLFLSPLISQSLMDIAWASLVLALIILFFQARKKKEDIFWSPKKIGVELLWGLWIASVFFGFIVNGQLDREWVQRTLEVASVVYLVYAVFSSLTFLRLDLKQVIRFIVIGMIAISLLSVIFYFIRGEKRMGGLIASPMPLAHIYGMLFLFVSTLFLYNWKHILKDRKELATWVASLALMAVVLVTALTRGVWLEVALVLVMISFFISWKMGLFVLSSVVSGVGILLLVWTKFRERFLFVLDFRNTHDSERLVLWETNFHIFKDHPWLGAGYGQNTDLLRSYYQKLGYPEGQFVSHAHNQFIHILAGTGIFGLLFYLAIHIFFLTLALKIYRQAPKVSLRAHVAMGAFAAQIGFAIGGLTEANFEHSKVRMVLFLIWGLLAYLKLNPHLGTEQEI